VSFYRKAVLAAAVAPLLMLQPVQASAETIFGAMAKAYENNPDLNAARAGLRATDEGVTIAKAGYRPQVSATASASAIDVYGMNGGATENSYHQANAGFTITQTIFDGFQTLNNVRSAEAGVVASRESLKANEISILLSAAQAYADIARDMQIVSIRKQNLQFLREQLNSANARLQVGEGTRTDVSQAEAQLASADALLASANAQLAISQATYVQIVGDTPTGIKQPSPARKAMPASVDQAVAIGVVEHPSVKAAFAQVDQADYNTKAAEGSLLPGVTLQGGVTRHVTSSSSPSDINNTSASITAQLTIPIYQGGAEYGRVRQAKELAGQRRIMVDSVRASVRQQIVSAYAQLRAATASISANGKSVNAAQLALKGVIEERNVGQKTTLDVLNSQQTVLNAKENLVVAQHDAVVASYSVIAAMGRLTVSSQGLQVAEYRSEDHYEAVKDKWFGLRTVDTK
jgi:outer membrane protein